MRLGGVIRRLPSIRTLARRALKTVIRVRPMTREDLALGLRLSSREGWNQTEADWIRLLDLEPGGGLVATIDDVPVATLTTCRFGPVAWVAMVLVDQTVRGRGVGKAIVARALDDLEGQGVRTVRLDATPMGRPLYERFGFMEEYTLARFAGTSLEVEGPDRSEPFDPSGLDQIIDLDRLATGTDRAKLLGRLVQDDSVAVRVVRRGPGIEGFIMSRPGAHAVQVGPCIAGSEVGTVLLAGVCSRIREKTMFLDIPTRYIGATAWAAGRGLTAQRHLSRMRRGEPVVERPEILWASSGPEMG